MVGKKQRDNGHYGFPLLKTAVALFVLLIVFVVLYDRGYNLRHAYLESVPVYSLRAELWRYYHSHGSAPDSLRQLAPQAGISDSVDFSTSRGLVCTLTFIPSNRDSKTVVRLTCGSPVMFEYEIAKDGSIVSKDYKQPAWLLALMQKRVTPSEMEYPWKR